MDLLTLRTRVRKQVGNPTTVDVPDADLTQHVNTAYRDISNKYRFHKVRKLCTFPTVAGTRRYGLPTDCAAVIRVRDTTNEVRLEKLDDMRAAHLIDTDVEGKPTQYTRYRDWLDLHPTPDDVYTIEVFYKGEIVDLSADGDDPVLPTSWHEGIIKLAKYYYYDEQGDIPKATSAFNAYELWASRQPIEVDEEKVDFDSGVSLPTLGNVLGPRLDFDHAD